jgi:hypothetical protein
MDRGRAGERRQLRSRIWPRMAVAHTLGDGPLVPSVLVGKTDLETVYPDGTGEGVMTPSVEDLGLAFGTAMLATRSAIRLLGTRAIGRSPRPSA